MAEHLAGEGGAVVEGAAEAVGAVGGLEVGGVEGGEGAGEDALGW